MFVMMAISLLLPLFYGSQTSIGGSIQGTVLDATTAKPVVGVQISLRRLGRTERLGVITESNSAVGTVRSDVEGSYSFSRLESGSYLLTFTKNGYAQQDYGQRTFSGRATVLSLQDGQAIDGLKQYLTPTGSVTGIIRSLDGRPLAGVPVYLKRLQFDALGNGSVRATNSGRTNDRGEYRLYYVTPGRYFLAAGTGPEAQPNPPVPDYDDRGIIGTPNVSGEKWSHTYYPGVASIAEATRVEVTPGQEVEHADIALASRQFYKIKGTVRDMATGGTPATVNISISFLTPSGSGTTGGRPTQNGTFELTDILPGEYIVSARLPQPNPQQSLTREQRDQVLVGNRSAVAGWLSVNVKDRDVTNVVLETNLSGSVHGNGHIDDSSATPALDWTSLRVQLQSSAISDLGLGTIIPMPTPVNGTKDGQFDFSGLGTDTYRIYASMPGYYLKAARYAESDILNRPFRLSGRAIDVVDLWFSRNAGRVEGFMTNGNGLPQGEAEAVLVPEMENERRDLYQATATRQDGHFVFDHVAPGRYRLFGWEAIEPYAYYDPEVMGPVRDQGIVVVVNESSTQTVAVKAISQKDRKR